MVRRGPSRSRGQPFHTSLRLGAVRFEAALDSLEPLDREVIALRHYEQLTNAETAKVLEMQESATSKRYIRALEKLRIALADLPENLTGFLP